MKQEDILLRTQLIYDEECKMKYKVIVYASFETEVDADSQDEAEEKAANESPFPYADYCESEMVIE